MSNLLLWVCAAGSSSVDVLDVPSSIARRRSSSRYGSAGDTGNLQKIHEQDLRARVSSAGCDSELVTSDKILGALFLNPIPEFVNDHVIQDANIMFLQAFFSSEAQTSKKLCCFEIVAATCFEAPLPAPALGGSLHAAKRHTFVQLVETEVESLLSMPGRCTFAGTGRSVTSNSAMEVWRSLGGGDIADLAAASFTIAAWIPTSLGMLLVRGAVPYWLVQPPWLCVNKHKAGGESAGVNLFRSVASQVVTRQVQEGQPGLDATPNDQPHDATAAFKDRLLHPQRFKQLALMLRQGYTDLVRSQPENEELLLGHIRWLEDSSCVLSGGFSYGLFTLEQGRWRYDCMKLLQAFFLARCLRRVDGVTTTLQQSLKFILPEVFVEDVLQACQARFVDVGSSSVVESNYTKIAAEKPDVALHLSKIPSWSKLDS